MFWHKVVNDGSVPLKYKEGKRTKKEYRSKRLSYKFNIPKGFVLGNEHQLKDRSTPEDICDLWGNSSEGIEVGFTYTYDNATSVSDLKALFSAL